MPLHLVFYLFSFAGIWIGSGIAIKSVERLARTLKASSFSVSFFILGFFTSVSEFSVGINSISHNNPEIYVGNLIGASIVLFILVIPLLAVFGNRIRVDKGFQKFNLPASLVVISLPAVLVLDGVVNTMDSIIALTFFMLLAISIQAKKGLFETQTRLTNVRVGKELTKIIFGIATIFIASNVAVEETLYFSTLLNFPPFLISLLVISVGTNIPELSLVGRSIFMRNHQVAFGDFVGSAAVNTFLLGFLTLLYGKPVLLSNSYLVSVVFLIIGLTVFYLFAKTKNFISQTEGLVLLGLYLLFLTTEIVIHNGL